MNLQNHSHAINGAVQLAWHGCCICVTAELWLTAWKLIRSLTVGSGRGLIFAALLAKRLVLPEKGGGF